MKIDSALDIAIKLTIERHQEKTGISTQELAKNVGIKSKQVFINKACLTNFQNKFTSDQLMTLQVVTGDNTISRVMTEIFNNHQKEATAQDIVNILLTVSVNNGDVIKVVRDAIADGKVTQGELQEALNFITKGIDNLEELQRTLIEKASQVKKVA